MRPGTVVRLSRRPTLPGSALTRLRRVPRARKQPLGVTAVDLVDHRARQAQPAESSIEVSRVHALGAHEKAPVLQPVGVQRGELRRLRFLRPVRRVAAVEDAILVADEEAPNLLSIARRLILE